MSNRLIKKCMLLAIALVGMIPNCSSVAPRAQEEESYFGAIGEGYTAASESGGIDVAGAGRILSAPEAVEFCQKAPRPAKLVALIDPAVLHVGTGFSIQSLEVLAVDASGRPLPPVPIMVQVNDTPCLITTPDVLARAGNWVIPIRAGRFHFRVKTICGNTPQASLEIQAEVLDEMKLGLPPSTDGTR